MKNKNSKMNIALLLIFASISFILITTFKQTLIGIIILLIGYMISKQKVVDGE